MQGETLLEEPFGSWEIALGARQCPKKDRYLGALLGVPGAGELEDLFQPRAALDQILAHIPEPKQSHRQAQSPFELALSKKIIERGAKVIDLKIATREPETTLGFTQLRVSFLRKNQAIRGMGPPDRELFAAAGEVFESIFANGLEHGKTRLGIRSVHTLNQVLIHQGRQTIKQINAKVATRVADGLGPLER